MKIRERYERYKKERDEVRTKIAIYEEKMREGREKLKEVLEELDEKGLGELGLELSVDMERLDDREYLTEVMEEIRALRNELGGMAARILEEGGF